MASAKKAAKVTAQEPTQPAGDYAVVKNLRHNGKGYEPGGSVTLDAKSATELVGRGVVKAAEKK